MQSKQWKIRRASLSDAGALSDCMKKSYAAYASRFEGQTLPPLTVDYEEEIRNYPVWVAESEGKIVGGLIMQSSAEELSIANVAVSPSFQGNGLGRGFLEFGEAEAKRLGYTELHLATHVLLTENISLYTYLGWNETSRDATRVYLKKILS